MKKEATAYSIGEVRGEVVQILKDEVGYGYGTLGVISALEAIFVEESSTKEDWFIVEDKKVFKVNREEWKIAQDREEEV